MKRLRVKEVLCSPTKTKSWVASLQDTFDSVETAATPPPENANMTFTNEIPSATCSQLVIPSTLLEDAHMTEAQQTLARPASPNFSGKTESGDPEGQKNPVAGSEEYQDPLFERGPPRSASPSTSRSTASTAATDDDV